MKRLLFIPLLLLIGCATLVQEIKMTPEIGMVQEAGIGDIFFKCENITGSKDPLLGQIYPGSTLFDLTIVELNQKKVGLQYSESFYSAPSHSPDSFTPSYPDGQYIKQVFNERFDYDPSNKIINFKEYAFEIMKIEGPLWESGRITYKRIK